MGNWSLQIFFFLCILSYTSTPGSLSEQVELPPPDLGPTASLNQTLALLREVLASHDSSVIPLDARQADFAQVKVEHQTRFIGREAGVGGIKYFPGTYFNLISLSINYVTFSSQKDVYQK